jgi:Aspartyl protease
VGRVSYSYSYCDEPPDVLPDRAFAVSHELWFPVIAAGVSLKGGPAASLLLLVDSGAAYCVFSKDVATAIGLSVRSGKYKKLPGLGGGQMDAYFHHVTVELRDGPDTIKREVYAAFIETPIHRDDQFFGILGQFGFLDSLRVTLDVPKRSIHFEE